MEGSIRKRLVVCIISYVLLVTTMSLANVPKLYFLSFEGQRTDGTIDRIEPWNHGLLFYVYRVKIINYQGVAHDSGVGNLPYNELKPGSEISVVYLPNDPAVSLPGDPLPNLKREVLVCAIFPALIAYLLWIALRARGF